MDGDSLDFLREDVYFGSSEGVWIYHPSDGVILEEEFDERGSG